MKKQVILVNEWLQMPTGKVAAQVSHASMVFISNAIKDDITNSETKEGIEVYYYDRILDHLDWLEGSFTKVVLQVRSPQEWEQIKEKLDKNHIQYNMIIDKGLTVFSGIPTHTCTGFAPMEQKEINKFFGSLPLLK